MLIVLKLKINFHRDQSGAIDQATGRDRLLDSNRWRGHLCSKDTVLLRQTNVLNVSITDVYMDHVFQYLVPLALSNGARKVNNAYILFSGTKISIIMKSIDIARTSFIKLRLFFHKVSFIINTLFSTFAWDAVCRSRKTLCWSVEAHCARLFRSSSSSTKRWCRNATFSGPKR